MPAYLGIGQTLHLDVVLIVNGNRHAVLLQAAPTADPLTGMTLSTTHGSGVLVDGSFIDLDDQVSLTAGTEVVVRVTYADAQASILSDFEGHLTLLSMDDGGVWHVQGSHAIIVRAAPPVFLARTTRAANDDLLLLVIAEAESAIALTITTATGSTIIPYGGLRSFGGSRAWLERLPANTTSALVTVSDDAGNASTLNATIAPRLATLPRIPTRWSVPPWLTPSPEAPHLDAVFAAAEAGTNDVTDASANVNPRLATGEYLDVHGSLYGAGRFVDEDDAAYRVRVLAIPTGQHITRDTLEAHLTRVAGGARIEIVDSTSQAAQGSVRLDGTNQLDGTWQLGGVGATLSVGEYIVRLTSTPTAPIEWVVSELQRLRPIGTRPTVQWSRNVTLGIARSLVGARNVDTNPPMIAVLVGEGDLTATLSGSFPIAADATGAGDLGAATLTAAQVLVTWIELETPDP